MTITKEGALASFYTVNKAPIKHLRVYFSPKQAGSGDPSPENVREIDGWNGIILEQTGKNLFNYKNANIINKKNRQNDGSEKIDSTGSYTGTFFPIAPNQNYIISQLYSTQSNSYYLSDINKNWISKSSYWKTNINTTQQTQTFTTLNNAYYFQLQSGDLTRVDWTPVQVELGVIATEYEPYQGHTYNLDWSNDIGTVYGGYVDLVTGELVEQWTYPLELGEPYLYASQLCFRAFPPNSLLPNASDPSLYDWQFDCLPKSKNATNGFGFNARNAFAMANNSALHNAGLEPAMIEIDGTNILNPWWTEWYSSLTSPPKIICTLSTPITHQLTPTQLQTLVGHNNIWSNADRVEVEYDLAESNDELYRRRNIILQGAPHLETATGNIANFKTDLAAPLKECKVNFLPVQTGSGDPSPNNVREIIGRNTINIKQNAGNLMNPIISASTQNETNTPVNVTVNSNGTITVAGRDGTSWQKRGKIDLPAGTYRLYSDFGNDYLSRYEINDVANEINWKGYKTLTLDEPSYLRFKPAMGTEYPVTGWLQLLYDNNDYDPQPYIENNTLITFPILGKNLLDITRTSKINPGVSASTITIQDGTIAIDAVSGSARSHVMFEQIFPAGTYTIQAQNSGAVGKGVLLSTTEFDGSSYNSYYDAYRKAISSSDNTLTFTLTAPSQIGLVLPNITNESGNPGTLYNIQLESGSTATAYEPYNNTIYGGYVDLIAGKLIATYYYFTVDENCNMYTYGAETYNGAYACNRCIGLPYNSSISHLSQQDVKLLYGDKINCHTTTYNWHDPDSHIWQACINAETQLHISFANNVTGVDMTTDTYAQSVNKIKNWLMDNNLHFAIPLKTPIEYPLTPQTFKTLKGVNNIWSDVNGPIEVQYWTH